MKDIDSKEISRNNNLRKRSTKNNKNANNTVIA